MIFNVRYDKIVPAIFHVTRLSPRVIPARFAGRLSFARKKRILRYTDLHLFLCVDNHMGMTLYVYLLKPRFPSQSGYPGAEPKRSALHERLFPGDFSGRKPSLHHRQRDVSRRRSFRRLLLCRKGPLLPYLPRIRSITLYHWNRSYPGDSFFDIPLDSPHWKLLERQNMTGHSHEKITKERYIFCRE